LQRLVGARPPAIVNASYLAELIGPGLEDWTGGVGFEVLREHPEALGTAGTLAALSERIGEPVLTHNADMLTDLDARALLEAHRRSGAAATVAVRAVDNGADLLPGMGRVAGFVDRRTEDTPGWQFIGAAVFEPDLIASLPKHRPLGLGEAVLAPLARRGELAAHEHHGYALDVGTPGRYLQASLDLLEGRIPGPYPSWPGEIRQVAGGRAYVAGEAGTAAIGPGAIVLSGAEVEPGATIERAIVWPGERVQSGTALRRCVFFGGRALELEDASA
jgi:NDP-sugar pyrophosphorylase family protein